MLTSLLSDAFARPLEVFTRLIDNHSVEELNWKPEGADNSIAWLAWHTAREIDVQIAHLESRNDLWERDGWVSKFGLDLPADSMGYGHTPGEAQAVKIDDKQLLLDYLRATVEDATRYVATVDDEAMEEIIDKNWDPPVMRATRIVSIIDDAAQHAGQADYLGGMITRLR
ncbi:mycothiol transferase [Flaviflexus massiliensis]|uniref:mycothiol transferase n=1 Tax=Flaviflexus massiliensis TaxID=1522309 RepID=UPI0006D54E93|nr:DinB family protein [Flaviflexus massiliensis]